MFSWQSWRIGYRCFHGSLWLKNANKRGAPWTPEEDQKLLELLRSLKRVPKWTTLEEYFPERSHLAIRSRARTLVGSRSISRLPFTEEEDEKLIQLVQTYGEDFLTLGNFIEKRSHYQCSRRWFLHLKLHDERAKNMIVKPVTYWTDLYESKLRAARKCWKDWLFAQLIKDIQEKQEIRDEHLLALHTLLPNTVRELLCILDEQTENLKDPVKGCEVWKSDCGEVVVLCLNQPKKETIFVFPSVPFCSCLQFHHYLCNPETEEEGYCNHRIVAQLLKNKCRVRQLSIEQWITQVGNLLAFI
eukprot:jgi/Galph1/5191/GphlegSOOS_G3832.1